LKERQLMEISIPLPSERCRHPIYENLNAEAPATKDDIMRLEAMLDPIIRQMGLQQALEEMKMSKTKRIAYRILFVAFVLSIAVTIHALFNFYVTYTAQGQAVGAVIPLFLFVALMFFYNFDLIEESNRD